MAPLREEDEDIIFIGTADIKGKDRFVVQNTSREKKHREGNTVKLKGWKRGERLTRSKIKRKKRAKPCKKNR